MQVHGPQTAGHCAPSTEHVPVGFCGQFGGGPESPPLEPPSEPPLLLDELPEPPPELDPPLEEDDAPSAIEASAAVMVPFEPPQLTTKASAGSTMARATFRTISHSTAWP